MTLNAKISGFARTGSLLCSAGGSAAVLWLLTVEQKLLLSLYSALALTAL